MAKWNKAALIAGAILLVLAGGAWWLFHSIDWLVKSTIESRGPLITGTTVTLSSVRVSTSDGRGTLSGFEVGNPPGFSSPYSLRAMTISVAIDPATITSDLPVIKDIVIVAPDVVYENNGKGSNLEAIQRNIDAAVRADAQAEKGSAGAAKSGARRFVIERILIRQARVNVLSPLLKGGSAHFVLPDVELHGLGSGGRGVTGAEAAKQVAAAMGMKIAVNAALSSDVLKKGLDGALDSLLNRRK